MRFIILLLLSFIFSFCTNNEKSISHNFSEIKLETVFEDSISIRAITTDDNSLMYAGDKGKYGLFAFNKEVLYSEKGNPSDMFLKHIKGTVDFNGKILGFRAIADTETHFFILSIESPAVLYRIDKKSKEVKLVYTETHEKAFYDAMVFWNAKEGIAIGDPTNDCLSVIITRDGGERWNKLSCEAFPKSVDGEAAFAASNGNIAVVGDHTWIVSGGMKSRVFYSSDKGNTWSVYDTPLVDGKSTTGAYSIDFYDKNHGVIFGGDYTKPKENSKNKAISNDGGKSWELVANGSGAGYKSCIRYVPNGGGKEMVAVGFTGISISDDYGENWQELSKEGFYTIRFVNDTMAFVAGKNRVSRVIFK